MKEGRNEVKDGGRNEGRKKGRKEVNEGRKTKKEG